MTHKCDTEARGNNRTHAFCLTIFNDEDKKTFLNVDDHVYKCWGEELCPTTLRPHFQAYLHFKHARYFSAIQKRFPHTSIRCAKGTAKQNQGYCSKYGKNEKFTEEGTLPEQGKRRICADELKTMSNEDIIAIDPRCHRAYINARNLLNADIDVDDLSKDVSVYWIQGPSGVGKTQRAKQLIRDNKVRYGTKLNIIKFSNGFFLGLGSAKIALYDDFRDSHMRPSEFINMIDYNRQIMNTKGAHQVNEYELIIITSVQNIRDIYKNVGDEPRKQWLRRIQLIDLFIDDADDVDVSDL